MLTPRGWIAAIAVGACALTGGSWPFALVLLGFFIPSTLLSYAKRDQKRQVAESAKGGPRNERQVLANGGIAAACAIGAALTHHPAFSGAFAGAFAAASADTWGTEIGTMLRAQPRSILTFARVPAGVSGGVTAGGTLAELGGAAVVAFVAQAAGVAPWWMVLAAGFAGALADSVAGASLQQVRFCPACRRECETDPHACGTPTRPARGVGWVDNDAVNALATGCGAVCAAALMLLR